MLERQLSERLEEGNGGWEREVKDTEEDAGGQGELGLYTSSATS